ncbi:autotransporter outer membrane beta-barrel domain-containing protein [Variovorax sp. OV329]|uniref:autotransporter outer membrane beta-barrel domain-containing protein n=1 Tax=Variovorax sp. OV329 TaxID=1882825 RepID=UPI0015874E19|nr:autotransporter outer membrane beta-barrel domain-containing protein [Variovorax sp. OV329]
MRNRIHPHRAARNLLLAAGCSACAGIVSAQAVRPETGALLGLQRQTDMIFVHGLDDRGDGTANQGKGSWLRGFGQGSKSTSDSSLYDVDGKSWGLQGGFDLPGPPRLQNWRFGVMGSYGGVRADGTAAGTSATSQGRGDGYGLGFYGTWFQDPARRLGWYADLWGHYAWFDNHVDTTGLARNDYKSHNTTGSAEAGYAIGLGDAGGWALTPQLQWVYIHNHSYNFIESDGTQVEGAHRGGWSSRLGLRIQRAAAPGGSDALEQAVLRPYAAINWWHDASGDEVVYAKTLSYKDLYPKDRFELKGGAGVAFGRQWSGWGELGWQTGSQSYSAWTASLGARYRW